MNKSSINAPRGMADRTPSVMRRHLALTRLMMELARRWDFADFDVPMMEEREVFARPLGDSSDIVTKEMYQLEDRSGKALVLRPEFTASIMRAVISGGLASQSTLRFCYNGPVFRYERPQQGRLRQFHQMGVEIIGSDSHCADLSCIACAGAIIEALGLKDKTRLRLNSLGCPTSRANYRKALLDYLTPRAQQLSELSRARLARNPMRILDSKEAEDRQVLKDAPLLRDHLTQESLDFFAKLSDDLNALDISFTLDQQLVRGLDYYTHTVFEFEHLELGAHATIIAGGRYDGLASTLGGGDIPAVGWAAGIERIALITQDQHLKDYLLTGVPPLGILPLADEQLTLSHKLAQKLRQAGIALRVFNPGSPKKRLGQALKQGMSKVIFIGEEELKSGNFQLKDLQSSSQKVLGEKELIAELAPKLT